MIALLLKDIKLGLQSPKESFLSINLKSVAGQEYACLSHKNTYHKILEISPSMYKPPKLIGKQPSVKSPLL